MAVTKEKLWEELNDVPDDILSELYNYMKYLKYKTSRKHEDMYTAYASEAVLKSDWEKPEEDEAWSNL